MITGVKKCRVSKKMGIKVGAVDEHVSTNTLKDCTFVFSALLRKKQGC